MEAIDVAHLHMTFRAPVRPEGLRSAICSLAHRKYREIHAVQDVSFRVRKGEIVGFLGPNGAGKTTTLKILSGILHPTDGAVTVLSSTPWKREPGFLKQIGMVRGSRPMSMPGELTVLDSLRFQQLIYEIPEFEYRNNLGELTDMLGLHGILERQVRALSLGERMRAGLAMALLYRPRVLFLDEPTIGLDVSAVTIVRTFIGEYARHTGATILLTSHNMADIEQVCRRIVLIDKGELRYDGELGSFASNLLPFKDVHVQFAKGLTPNWHQFGEVLALEDGQAHLRVARSAVPDITARILAETIVMDLSVTNPPLESVMERAFRAGAA